MWYPWLLNDFTLTLVIIYLFLLLRFEQIKVEMSAKIGEQQDKIKLLTNENETLAHSYKVGRQLCNICGRNYFFPSRSLFHTPFWIKCHFPTLSMRLTNILSQLDLSSASFKLIRQKWFEIRKEEIAWNWLNMMCTFVKWSIRWIYSSPLAT